MKKSTLLLLSFVFISFTISAQKGKNSPKSTPTKPKLVVGIVVDQMKYDYLNRFGDRFGKGGFNRLRNEGINCTQGYYSYGPTVTAAGHASVYTGTVPAIHGIVGNEWIEVNTGHEMYCVEDSTVLGVGAKEKDGQMSPRNLWTSTITDQLKLSQDFKSKTIAMSIKDRGAVLPGGHSANAAYWYNASIGGWISSTYYMKELPKWVQDLNESKPTEKYLKGPWETLYPIETYRAGVPDENDYENWISGNKESGFPHELTAGGRKENTILTSPYGNSILKDFAIEALKKEQLGKGNTTDFLAISFSSTDYVGHSFGPHSIEIEDVYLRLDKDIEELLNTLDAEIGQGNYLVFLSADHAVADVPGYLNHFKLPGGVFSTGEARKAIEAGLKKKYGDIQLIEGIENSQIYLNRENIRNSQIDKEEIFEVIYEELRRMEGFSRLINLSEIGEENIQTNLQQKIKNGYHPLRSGDFMILLKSQWFSGGKKGTTHGSIYEYDSHVPILFYGWKLPAKNYLDLVNIQDIAASLAHWLEIDAPSGNIGKPVNISIIP